jgi:hypothetical protein
MKEGYCISCGDKAELFEKIDTDNDEDINVCFWCL